MNNPEGYVLVQVKQLAQWREWANNVAAWSTKADRSSEVARLKASISSAMISATQPTASNAGERELFEDEQNRNVQEYSKGRHLPHLERVGEGYQNPMVHHAWRGWQARAALTSKPVAPPAREAQKPAFVYNGEEYRDLESMLEGYNHGTEFFTAPPPEPVAARGAGERWLNVESAMSDPLFQQARAIMGTENWFQDNALRNVINYVLSATPPAQAVQDKEVDWSVEAAAMKLAEVMDYPWTNMPDEGRMRMRRNADAVVRAARTSGNGMEP